jgi:hypothetical protein
MYTSNCPSVEFSDPCFIRVSSVAQNRLIIPPVTRNVVSSYGGLSPCCRPRLEARLALKPAQPLTKNAHNEANGDQLQVLEGERHGLRFLDSGIGKRSHFKDQGHFASELLRKKRRSGIAREMITGFLLQSAAGPSSGSALGVFS